MFTSVNRWQARANARKLPPTDTSLHGIAVGVQNEAEMAKLHEPA